MKAVKKDTYLKLVLNIESKIQDLHRDLSFLPEIMKAKKCNKLVYNLHNKEKYIAHIRTLNQALNRGLIPKKVPRVIKFNQEPWLKPYIDINIELRQEAKTILQ